MSLEHPTDLATRLIPRDDDVTPRTWDIPFPEAGSYVVTGPAGSGLTSFLADTVLHHIEQGQDPDSILVVSSSKESGARLREDITTRLAAANGQEFVSNPRLSARCTRWPLRCCALIATKKFV